MVGPQRLEEGGSIAVTCKMQFAYRTFVPSLPRESFQRRDWRKKLNFSKLFKSCVSGLQGVSRLTSSEYRKGGITGIFWATCLQQTSSPHGANCTSSAGSDHLVAPTVYQRANKNKKQTKVLTNAVENWPPRNPTKIKKIIPITESSTLADATNPDCIRIVWLQTQPSTWTLGMFTNISMHLAEIINCLPHVLASELAS